MSKNKKNQEKAEKQEVEKEEKETVEKKENSPETEKTASEATDNEASEPSKEEKEIEDLKKAKAEVEKQLSEKSDKLAKTEDAYVRLMAEFDNYRRRTSQEKLDLVSTAASDTIKGLLVVLDDCERAMKALSDSTDVAVAKEGTELIYNKLMAYLKGKGLTTIEALGETFDTDEHEAIAQVPVEEKEKKGKVYDVVQTGYKLNGKVIRFAKVVVGI